MGPLLSTTGERRNFFLKDQLRWNPMGSLIHRPIGWSSDDWDARDQGFCLKRRKKENDIHKD